MKNVSTDLNIKPDCIKISSIKYLSGLIEYFISLKADTKNYFKTNFKKYFFNVYLI